MSADEDPDIVELVETMRQGRRLAGDLVVTAGLIGLVYATPARWRPALGLATAVALSRVHGAGVRQVRDDYLRLFDERRSVTARVDRLEDEIADISANRIGQIERVIRRQYGGRSLLEIIRDA